MNRFLKIMGVIYLTNLGYVTVRNMYRQRTCEHPFLGRKQFMGRTICSHCGGIVPNPFANILRDDHGHAVL